MDLAHNRRNRGYGAVASNEEHFRGGGVEGGRSQHQAVTVTPTGRNVRVRDDMYSNTNFYIQQSRPYLPSRDLHTYIYFRGFSQITYVLLIVAFTLLTVTTILVKTMRPAIFVQLGGVIFLCLLPFTLVYIQHLKVVIRTIPWVLRQPTVANMAHGNQHLEVAVTNMESTYVTARNIGIGFTSQTSGKFHIQVLSSSAVETMKWTQVYSIVYFILLGSFTLWAAIIYFIW